MKLYSKGVDPLHNLDCKKFPKKKKTDHQLLHSWDFHDVLCRLAWLKIGTRAETVNSNMDKAHFSTSIKNRKSCPRLLRRRSTNS